MIFFYSSINHFILNYVIIKLSQMFMKNKIFYSLLAILISGFLSAQPLNGTYTIGGSNPSFNTFNDAINSLQTNGVSGPVLMKIRDGNYPELLFISAIPGASSLNSISFEGESQDSSLVVVNGSTIANQENTLFLNQAGYITFKHIKFIQTANVNNNAVVFLNRGKYITFTNCHIQGHNSSTSSGTEYLIQGGCDSSLVIRNCYLLGAKNGIIISNSFSHRNLVIENNFVSSGGWTIRINGGAFATVSKNTTGKVLFESTSRVTCYSNRIFGYLQLISSNGWANQPARIYNNQIIMNGLDLGASYGLRCSSSSYLDIAFNSISINSPMPGYAMFVQGTFSENLGWLKVRNNNIMRLDNTANNHIFYIPNAISYIDGIEMSNNNYYTAGPNFTHNYANLQEWQNLTGLDTNSINVNPLPNSSTDLYSNAPELNGAAIPLAYAETDINGNFRNPVNPDIGAFEQLSAPIVNLGNDFASCSNIELDAGNAGASFLWNTGETTQQITINNSGIYYVTVTNNLGSDIDSIEVIINSPTLFTISASDTTICAGTSVVLYNTEGLELDWQNNGAMNDSIQFIATSDTTVNVNYTNLNGCESNAIISLTVNAIPNVSYDYENTILCNTENTISLFDGIPLGGTFTINGVTGNELNPSLFTNEYVSIIYSYTNVEGCIGFSEDSVFIDVCSNVSEYVNQFYDEIILIDKTVYMKTTNNENNYILYDLSGRILKQGNFINSLELNEFSNGIYFITINTKSSSLVKKLYLY